MPAKSKAQARLMAAAAHGANFGMAKKVRASMSREQMQDFYKGQSQRGKPEHVKQHHHAAMPPPAHHGTTMHAHPTKQHVHAPMPKGVHHGTTMHKHKTKQHKHAAMPSGPGNRYKQLGNYLKNYD